jgi:hypothetical protein
MHDIPKYERMKARMEFVTHEIVGMVQNVSQNRDNKKITHNDLRYCISAGFLSFYPGTKQFPQTYNVFKQPGAVHGRFWYVIGNANGTASVKWTVQYQLVNGSGNTTPGTMTIGSATSDSDQRFVTKFKNNVAPSEVCPQLSIKPGEAKIILENSIYFVVYNFKLTNGKNWSQYSPREAFGFWLLTPKAQGGEFYFHSVVIFTPKPGLFDETPPR